MLTIQKQLEERYKKVSPDNLIKDQKYLFTLNNYKIFGKFEKYHKKSWDYTKFGIINNMICNISPRGFTIFSLEDIRIRQAHMYFKDKLPFEIIIIIGKKWAILS
jgi:hypothetical protein